MRRKPKSVVEYIEDFGREGAFEERKPDPSVVWERPTQAEPGSDEKIQILKRRIESGVSPHMEGDKKHEARMQDTTENRPRAARSTAGAGRQLEIEKMWLIEK